MLPVLAEAGVVDAGAAGLVEILRGIAGVLAGEPLPEAPLAAEPPPTVESLHAELSRVPLLHRASWSRARGSTPTSSSASSSRSATRCSSSATRPRSRFTSTPTIPAGRSRSPSPAGTLANVEIADMHAQTLDRRERLLHAVPEAPRVLCAVVAVASGAGNRALFENLGAHVVDGGRTMNPSTAELLAAVAATGAREAILLPNDRNVVLTAEHAAEVAEVPVSVVPTRHDPGGLAAALAFDPR